MSNHNAFGRLPQTANEAAVKPFRIDIHQDAIDRMKALIQQGQIADGCYENESTGNRLGVQREWLSSMKDKWLNDFDWKHHEHQLNTFPHFLATVTSPESNLFEMHFTGLFSSRNDALPILLSHGWPGSFLEFIPMLRLIRDQYKGDPSQMPYHFVVPSLPGFGFSSMPPASEDFHRKESIAVVMDDLMMAIFGGQARYVAQGGDIGSFISRILASGYDSCIAAHLNFNYMEEPSQPEGQPPLPVEDVEKRGLSRKQEFRTTGIAYAMLQGTRPSTLGLALSSSPLALLTWIGEKFLDWSDPASFPENPPHSSPNSDFATDILLNASLYWLTGHIATTFYTYREVFEAMRGAPPSSSHDAPKFRIEAPKMLGFSWFPMDVAPVPISWIGETGNLVWWKRHEVGGHFAALERPKVLWADLQEFLSVVTKSLEGSSEE